MRIAYFDESGDDGFPKYSSPLFVLSTLYIHYLTWQETHDLIVDFRRQLKKDYGFPIRLEMHARHFLANKNPYKPFGWSDEDRTMIVSLFCKLIGSLNAKIINCVIVKPRIIIKDYEVLSTSLTYTIQRIENDLNPTSNPNERFLIVTDNGRVNVMRTITRQIQRINYIPSKFYSESIRREIRTLIEDPLPKDSAQSYFIQLCDIVAYVVYLYSLSHTNTGELSNRIAGFTIPEQIRTWLIALKPVFNLKASPDNEFGILFHPK